MPEGLFDDNQVPRISLFLLPLESRNVRREVSIPFRSGII